MVSQPKPPGMVLRSQSRAGRSEVVVSAEIHPERPAPGPEPEIVRQEVEFASVAGPSSDPTAVGTSFPSPSTRCGTEIVAETLSGYPFPARRELEITPIPFQFPPPRATLDLSILMIYYLTVKLAIIDSI